MSEIKKTTKKKFRYLNLVDWERDFAEETDEVIRVAHLMHLAEIPKYPEHRLPRTDPNIPGKLVYNLPEERAFKNPPLWHGTYHTATPEFVDILFRALETSDYQPKVVNQVLKMLMELFPTQKDSIYIMLNKHDDKRDGVKRTLELIINIRERAINGHLRNVEQYLKGLVLGTGPGYVSITITTLTVDAVCAWGFYDLFSTAYRSPWLGHRMVLNALRKQLQALTAVESLPNLLRGGDDVARAYILHATIAGELITPPTVGSKAEVPKFKSTAGKRPANPKQNPKG